MGREAICSPATATLEKPDTDDQEAATVKNSNGSFFLADAAAVASTKNALKIPSYTVAGRSMGDLVLASFQAAYNDNLREALRRVEFNFVLTDPRIEDNPIVYASDGFLRMTGYTAEEVLGRNCRFLQGPATNRHTIVEIRDAIREERACQVSIINYTKEGKPFWNLFRMAPVYSKEDGRVVHFIGVQTPIMSNCNRSSAALKCFRAPASPSEASPTNQHTHSLHADPLKHDTPGDVDEDNCGVMEAHKRKAKLSVDSLMSELTSKCKGVGVAETRCNEAISGRGTERVICSSLMLSLTKVHQSFVLTSPHIPDSPIVHASEMFLRLTGYSREEVVGRNCRFLQGPNTDCRAVQLIVESLRAEKSCTVRLLNYRKDKTPFWNLLHIAPIRCSSGKVAFFAGVQLEVAPVEEPCFENETRPDIRQLGAIGAVRVAVRSLQGEGLRRIHKRE